MTLVEGE